ncbi:hypothetical protein BKA62DRAFT_836929 [Auriculariales sp. MPI-PUGE-AT-0066]|nr:hypothetical protein BKA62DRAFT_836929 [Auriculariales sp. MPI-PUGE-AT-0066]
MRSWQVSKPRFTTCLFLPSSKRSHLRPAVLVNVESVSHSGSSIASHHPGGPAQLIRVDDADPAVEYSSDNWVYHERASAEEYWNATNTWSSTGGAYCQLRFNGTSIEWWGQTHDVHGPCDVQVDGVTRATVQGPHPQSSPVDLLWKQDNLAADVPHTIRVTVVGNTNGGFCSIDYFLYTPVGVGETPSSTGTTTSTPSPSSTTAGATNTGLSSSDRITIISSIVGGLLAFASIIVAVYFGIKQLKKDRHPRPRRASDDSESQRRGLLKARS